MPSEAPEWETENEFDGGEAGCGELLMDMFLYFKPLAPGTRVRVHTRDPGAPVEIPAWCRLRGYELIDWKHPYYFIEKR